MKSRRTQGHQRRRFTAVECLETRAMLTLAISEINFNPYDSQPELGESAEVMSNEYEFIELTNQGESAIDLSGYQLRKTIDDQGVNFSFSATSLAPMERIVVVENAEIFPTRYGTNVNVAGEWSGGLSNDREVISLYHHGVLSEQVEYKSTNKWPTRADGLGASLERKDFTSEDLSDPDVWRSSVEYGGSPGQAPRINRDSPIIINEVLAHTDIENNGHMDAIELRNVSDEPVDVSGWFLTDNVVTKTLVFSIAPNTIIPAQGYLVLTETDFNPNMNGFALSEAGEPTEPGLDEGGLWLLEGGGNGRPVAFADRVTFTPTFNGTSVGNVLDVDQSSKLQQLESLTFGRANGGHRVGEVIINEVQYRPADDDVFKEFIELQSGTFSVDLSGWQIADAVDVIFPAETILPANSTLVLVAFDPDSSPELANEFRSYYGIDTDVELIAWGADKEGIPDRLNNSGETITLTRPEADLEFGTLFITIDQVNFGDSEPWPEVADGDGGSIQRRDPILFGNFADSWEGITPTPGNQNFDLSNNEELFLDTPIASNIGTDGNFIRGEADVDLYRFNPTETDDYSFEISSDSLTGARTRLRVFSTDGTELAMQKSDLSKSIELTVPLEAGEEYLVGVNGDSEKAANYDPLTGKGITIGDLPGTYNLSVSASEVPLPSWQNLQLPEDVDGKSGVSPIDALIVINWLNKNPTGVLPSPGESGPPPYLDVNGDGSISPIDPLFVINYLNNQARQTAVAARPIDLFVSPQITTSKSFAPDFKNEHVENHNQLISKPLPSVVDLLFTDDDDPRKRKSNANLASLHPHRFDVNTQF